MASLFPSMNTTLETTVNLVYGAMELGSVLVGLTLNPLTLPYFYRNREQLSSILYVLIVVTGWLQSAFFTHVIT